MVRITSFVCSTQAKLSRIRPRLKPSASAAMTVKANATASNPATGPGSHRFLSDQTFEAATILRAASTATSRRRVVGWDEIARCLAYRINITGGTPFATSYALSKPRRCCESADVGQLRFVTMAGPSRCSTALAPDRSALMGVVCHTARIGLTSTIAADQPCRIIMAASATATLVRDVARRSDPANNSDNPNPPSSRNSSNQSTRLGGDQTEMRLA